MTPETTVGSLSATLSEVEDHVRALQSFWTQRAPDPRHGGYRTNFDAGGVPVDEGLKYLLSHTRLLWSFSALAEANADDSLLEPASLGFEYLRSHFLDRGHGGWNWTVNLDGSTRDSSKLVYGQSFAIYALATYGRVAQHDGALQLARETFDNVMKHAADTACGGYYENFDDAWRLGGDGSGAGERKSLDIHMHLLEAFTELARATGDREHLRRLSEVRHIILTHMIDARSGAGGNQFTPGFAPIDPVVIAKTWIAERAPTDVGVQLPVTTSYGHNLELGWLLREADLTLGIEESVDHTVMASLARHALRYGYDERWGGVYREGPPDGPASDLDKEFWQNAEALVGLLSAYQLTDDPEFLDAFHGTWQFARAHLIHPTLGEWRTRTRRDGTVVDGALGNHWTGGYHTIRAALETRRRLADLLGDPAVERPEKDSNLRPTA